MTKRALAAAVACLMIVAVAAGCGGGGDSTSGAAGTSGGETTSSEATTGDATTSEEGGQSSGEAPSKAAFIKEADSICRAADAKLSEEVTAYAKEHDISLEKEPSKDQQIEIYEAVVLPNIAGQHDELAALTPPAGEEEAVEEIVDALGEGVEEAEADPSKLTEGENPLSEASTKAGAFGMKECGSGG